MIKNIRSKTVFFQLLSLLSLSFLVFGAGSASALPTPDSSSWKSSHTYAATIVNEGACTNDGGNADNDGICKNWKDQTKHNGLHISFLYTIPRTTQQVNYTYNLPCDHNAVYANPGSGQHVDPTGITICPQVGNKDVYVELDWMHNQTISNQAIADVVATFHKHGINLHVQPGEDGSTTGDILVNYCNVNPTGTLNSGTAGQACTNPPNSANIQSYPVLKQNFFGTSAERNPPAGGNTSCPRNDFPSSQPQPGNLYTGNCLTAKRQVFHYATAVVFQAGQPAYSGWSERYGNDFIISLGNFQNGGVGNIDEQEASIMHELGHNLALDHGGKYGDQNNCKPNYPSVMNYVYEFRESADSCRPLDYSTASLSSLPQNSLSDSSVGSYPYPSDNPLKGPDGQTAPGGGNCPTSSERKIWWSLGANDIGNTTGTQNNNWNQAASPLTYSQVLNNIGSTCGAVTTSPYPTLNSNDDWNCIKNGCGTVSIPMNFRSSSSFINSNPQIESHDESVSIGPDCKTQDMDFSSNGHKDKLFSLFSPFHPRP